MQSVRKMGSRIHLLASKHFIFISSTVFCVQIFVIHSFHSRDQPVVVGEVTFLNNSTTSYHHIAANKMMQVITRSGSTVRRINVMGQVKMKMSMFRERYGLFVNGAEVFPPDSTSFRVDNPATGQNICEVVEASSNDVAMAADAAQKAFESGVWSQCKCILHFQVHVTSVSSR